MGTNSVGATPPADTDSNIPAPQTLPNNVFGLGFGDEGVIGSPLKKHRASLFDVDAEAMQKRSTAGFPSGIDVLAAAEAGQKSAKQPEVKMETEEEL